MRTGAKTFVFALAASVIAAQPVSAQLAPTKMGKEPAPPANAVDDRMSAYKAAGIDAKQEKKIMALGNDFENFAHDKASRAMALRKELFDLSLQPDPDAKVVMSKQHELDKLFIEMSDTRMQLMLNIRAVMTPAQKIKLVAVMKEHYAHRAQAGGAMPMPGGPGSLGTKLNQNQKN